MRKAELRKIYLEKQTSLPDYEREEKSARVAVRFFENFNLKNVRFLHIFLPIERTREIRTHLIVQRLWKDFPNANVVVPRIDFETQAMENLLFTPAAEPIKNKWDIPEPTGNELVEIAEIDVCLVPLLCFDERGFRVGYGKGFYDVFLSRCRADCRKIGLSYFAPVAEISDAQTFDVKLDFCVTPQTVFEFGKMNRE